ncbi:MAG TPA: S8/S53 family peptidase [Oryzihumus sp.]|nr:S8/S53 family peptidase [Oryzihumus sp.]
MSPTTARPTGRWRRVLVTAVALTLGLGTTLASALSHAPAAQAAPHIPSVLPAADRPSQWWYDAMGYDELHKYGTGKGITVAMIDLPIDPDVPELKGKLASVKTLCPNQRLATARDASADHATNVASLIVGTGRGNGGPGVRGIAPDATLRYYAIGKDDNDICNNSVDQTMGQTVDQAVKDGAKIISISLSGQFNQPYFIESLARAERAGVIVVAGTDDQGGVYYPALANGVVSVNFVDRHGKLDPDAAHGTQSAGKVDIAAPGTNLLMGSHQGGRWVSGTCTCSGSSLATPLVAGGLAAVWSHFPQATGNQLLQMMVNTPGLKQGTTSHGTRGWVYDFRRVGSGFPGVRQSGGGYGWGIFDPADMMYRTAAQFPDVNPVLEVSNADTVLPTWSQVTGKPLPGQGASATATGTPSATSGAAANAPRSTGGGGSPLPWVLGGVVIVLVAAGGAAMAVRRGRSRQVPAKEKALEGSSHGSGS